MRLYFNDCYFCVHESNQINYIQVFLRAERIICGYVFSQKWWYHPMQIWIGPAVINFKNFLMSFLDRRCLILLPEIEKPTILDTTNISFTLSLPSVTTQQLCPGISQPTPTYLVFLEQMTNSRSNSSHSLSTLQQKTLVWLFWHKSTCDIY